VCRNFTLCRDFHCDQHRGGELLLNNNNNVNNICKAHNLSNQAEPEVPAAAKRPAFYTELVMDGRFESHHSGSCCQHCCLTDHCQLWLHIDTDLHICTVSWHREVTVDVDVTWEVLWCYSSWQVDVAVPGSLAWLGPVSLRPGSPCHRIVDGVSRRDSCNLIQKAMERQTGWGHCL